MKQNQGFTEDKKIAKNTVFLYVRMLLIMFLSFYSSRLVLNKLGVQDFGIYNIVGGFVAIMSIISAGFSNSSQRFIIYSLGEKNFSKIHLTFVTILNIHFILAFVIFILGETVGLWFVNNYLVIPQSRILAANFVYQFSLITVILNLINIPYTSIIMSYERLNIISFVSVIESVLKLVAILLLAYVKSDILINYAAFLMLIAFLLLLYYVIYCKINFLESKYLFKIDKDIFTDIFRYVIWAYLGNFAGIFKEQGINVIVNLFFGVTVNAARAIAMQVYSAVNSLSANLITAFNPQIIKNFASGDTDRSLSLTKNSTRFSIFLLLLIALPIILETKILLQFWLVNVPLHSEVFVKLITLLCISRAIQQPATVFYFAIGKIKKSQIFSSIFVAISVVLSYLFFKMGASPESSIIISIITELLSFIVLLYLIREQVPYDIVQFVIDVFGKVLIVTVLSLVIPLCLHFILDEGFLRLIIVALATFISVLIAIYFFGITIIEKEKLNTFIFKRVKKWD